MTEQGFELESVSLQSLTLKCHEVLRGLQGYKSLKLGTSPLEENFQIHTIYGQW